MLFCVAVFLYILSFPPLNFSFSAFFALSFLFYLSYGKTKRKALLIFFVAGIIVSLIHLHWLLLLEVEPWVEKFLIVGFLLLVLYLSIYWAIFGYLFAHFTQIGFGLREFLVIPSIWVIFEFIRSKGVIGFPWVPLWLSQLGNLPLAQSVSLFGPFGLSFLIVLLNIALFWTYIDRKRGLRTLISVFLLVIILSFWGKLRMENLKDEKRELKVAIFQPNVLPRYLFEAGEWKETEEAYLELNKSLEDSVDLIVFSESALPGFYKTSKLNKELIGKILAKHPAYIIIGSADFERKEEEFKLYNTAFLLDEKGFIVNKYHKTHLVPFGEWIPYEDHIPFLKNLDFGQGDYLPGKELVLFRVKNVNLGTLICFESIFPEISREYVRKGADILVNITSDGWYGKSIGPLEHFELARFRAIETGSPIIRAAKTGISAYIDERGRIVRKIGLFKRGILVVNVKLRQESTLYTKIGDKPIFIILILIVLFLLVYNQKKFGG